MRVHDPRARAHDLLHLYPGREAICCAGHIRLCTDRVPVRSTTARAQRQAARNPARRSQRSESAGAR